MNEFLTVDAMHSNEQIPIAATTTTVQQQHLTYTAIDTTTFIPLMFALIESFSVYFE